MSWRPLLPRFSGLVARRGDWSLTRRMDGVGLSGGSMFWITVTVLSTQEFPEFRKSCPFNVGCSSCSPSSGIGSSAAICACLGVGIISSLEVLPFPTCSFLSQLSWKSRERQRVRKNNERKAQKHAGTFSKSSSTLMKKVDILGHWIRALPLRMLRRIPRRNYARRFQTFDSRH